MNDYLPHTYKVLAEFAQTWGLVYFVIVFLLVVAYAFWPSSKKKFNEAARIPLRED
jgi:cytochrome c oxidase cbb3-type subunit 4